MLYLQDKQLDFLISISKADKIMCDTLSDSQLKLINYLENEKLIEVQREIVQTSIDPETHKLKNVYGNPLSVSILPKGIAYLAESKHRKFYFWIPIIIDSILSVSAIIISIIALCE